MKKANPRTKREIRRDPRTPEYASTAYEELVRLKEYYENEVLQIETDLENLTYTQVSKAFEVGKATAYKDHVEEITFVIELIRGQHLEENDKRVKTL